MGANNSNKKGKKMSETFEKVKKVIVEKLGVDEADVVETANFINDLGADSLDVVEFVMERFEMLGSLLNFLPVDQIFATLVPVSFGLGIGIGFLGSFMTVRKHLKV